MNEPRVIATGHRNGTLFRYAEKQWTEIGKVRCEQLGPRRWRAFASLDTYTEATNRNAAVRAFLAKIGIDPSEYGNTAMPPRIPDDVRTCDCDES